MDGGLYKGGLQPHSMDGGLYGGGGQAKVEEEEATPAGPRYRRLDLKLVPYESYSASTLYFTGSDEHNKLMRNEAIAKGMRLSEYGLFKLEGGKQADRPLRASTEADLFELLGMAYKEPHERNL